MEWDGRLTEECSTWVDRDVQTIQLELKLETRCFLKYCTIQYIAHHLGYGGIASCNEMNDVWATADPTMCAQPCDLTQVQARTWSA